MEKELRQNLESIKSQLIELRGVIHEKRQQIELEYDRAFDLCPTSSETRYYMALSSNVNTAYRNLSCAIEYLVSALEV